MSFDLLAFSAWSQPAPARARYSRIGYEVKVSRADYRRELLRPSKRVLQVAFCHEFYFAVPEGLLAAHEVAWEEPEWARDPDSFRRELCTAERCYREARGRRYGYTERVETMEEDDEGFGRPPFKYVWVTCETCGGKGHLGKSRVEREAPTLWVPADVGLVTVGPRGCHVAKLSPLRKPELAMSDMNLADLVRWVSMRPDARHTELREA